MDEERDLSRARGAFLVKWYRWQNALVLPRSPKARSQFFAAALIKNKQVDKNSSLGTSRSQMERPKKFRYTADSAALCIIETLAK